MRVKSVEFDNKELVMRRYDKENFTAFVIYLQKQGKIVNSQFTGTLEKANEIYNHIMSAEMGIEL